MNNLLSKLNKLILPPKTSLEAELIDAITDHQKVVIQKVLESIAKDYEAQGVLAQLKYLQSINSLVGDMTFK